MNSLRIPNGTAFMIACRGMLSGEFASGACLDGVFRVHRGPGAGVYRSANRAVSAVRFDASDRDSDRHIYFEVGTDWIRGDDLRREADLTVPHSHDEREALRLAGKLAVEDLQGSFFADIETSPDADRELTAQERERLAEALLELHPEMVSIFASALGPPEAYSHASTIFACFEHALLQERLEEVRS